MARWRYSGFNWEGRHFHVSAALETLGRFWNERYPDRHPADGTVASKGHDANSPKSDHRPYPYTGDGTVRAIDIGVHEDEGEALYQALKAGRDPRLKYVIYKGKMFASYHRPWRLAWRSGPYLLGGHAHHLHISVNESADTDGRLLKGVENAMALNQVERIVVDIAFDLFGAQGDRTYWYDLDPDHPEFAELMAPAVARGIQELNDALKDTTVDQVARDMAGQANSAASRALSLLSRIKSVL